MPEYKIFHLTLGHIRGPGGRVLGGLSNSKKAPEMQCSARCPLLAQSGRCNRDYECPLLRVKRTFLAPKRHSSSAGRELPFNVCYWVKRTLLGHHGMSANDPKRTSHSRQSRFGVNGTTSTLQIGGLNIGRLYAIHGTPRHPFEGRRRNHASISRRSPCSPVA